MLGGDGGGDSDDDDEEPSVLDVARAFLDDEAFVDDDDDDDEDDGDSGDKMDNEKRGEPIGKWEASINALSSLDIGADFCAEVSMKKKRINDNKPIVVGLAILQHAKLLLLKFMNFIGKFFSDKTK